jgi:hypothetical protein
MAIDYRSTMDAKDLQEIGARIDANRERNSQCSSRLGWREVSGFPQGFDLI